MHRSVKLPATHSKILLLPRADDSLIGVISNGVFCYVADLVKDSVEMDLGKVLGYPLLDTDGNVLFVARDSMRICRLTADLKMDQFSIVVPGNISRFVAKMGSVEFVEFDGPNGGKIASLDFERFSISEHIKLPADESLGSGMIDFGGKAVVLSQSDDGVRLRDFVSGDSVLYLEDVVDYLPKTDLKIRVNSSSVGTFVHELMDRDNRIQIRYEHLTTDPCGRLVCPQETALAFVSSVSPLFRLSDKRRISELGHYPAVTCDSRGLRLAVLEGIELRIVDIDTEVSRHVAKLDRSFNHLQFTASGKKILLDNRSPFNEMLDWDVVDAR